MKKKNWTEYSLLNFCILTVGGILTGCSHWSSVFFPTASFNRIWLIDWLLLSGNRRTWIEIQFVPAEPDNFCWTIFVTSGVLMVGASYQLRSTRVRAASRMWEITDLNAWRNFSIPMWIIGNVGLQGVMISVIEDIIWNTWFQKLVKLEHSQNVSRRWPVWPQFHQHKGKVFGKHFCKSVRSILPSISYPEHHFPVAYTVG